MDEEVGSEPEAEQLLLVVDDDELLREALVTALRARGFRVAERSCGESALRYLREGELPDLILLDLVMPNMDGWEFRATQLQDSALAGIPVVVLSGDRSAKARALHAQAFLPKPPTTPQLVRTVESVLEQARKAKDAEHEASARLVQFAELVEEAVRPVRVASDITLSNLDAALELLMCNDTFSESRADRRASTCDERSLERLLFWLSGARVAACRVSDDIARAELFAHRHVGRLRADRARVLIVDDDEPRRTLLVEGLRELCLVSAVSSAVEALAILRELDDYDVVVCRLLMARGSGVDLLQCLHSSRPEQAARLLFLSADTPQELLEERRIAQFKHLGILHGAPSIAAIRAVIAQQSDATQH